MAYAVGGVIISKTGCLSQLGNYIGALYWIFYHSLSFFFILSRWHCSYQSPFPQKVTLTDRKYASGVPHVPLFYSSENSFPEAPQQISLRSHCLELGPIPDRPTIAAKSNGICLEHGCKSPDKIWIQQTQRLLTGAANRVRLRPEKSLVLTYHFIDEESASGLTSESQRTWSS